MTVYRSILDMIGNTPVVDVSVLSPNPDVSIFVKLEGQNPGGSVKDRPALSMIEDAERSGLLTPGATLLEPDIRQYRDRSRHGVPREGLPPEGRAPEQRLGASDASFCSCGEPRSSRAQGRRVRTALCVQARALAAEHPEWVFLYQYGNPANPRAHYEGTGPEILRDCPDITHFVAGLGTSGTLLGVGRYLKEHRPDVQLWAIEPPAGEMVDGLRNLDDGYIPPIFTELGGEDLLDRKTIVGPRDSIVWTRRLSDLGIFAGISSGAALAGAVKCAASIEQGVIVFVAADGGWKYLSTDAWTGDIDEVVERARKTIYF